MDKFTMWNPLTKFYLNPISTFICRRVPYGKLPWGFCEVWCCELGQCDVKLQSIAVQHSKFDPPPPQKRCVFHSQLKLEICSMWSSLTYSYGERIPLTSKHKPAIEICTAQWGVSRYRLCLARVLYYVKQKYSNASCINNRTLYKSNWYLI